MALRVLLVDDQMLFLGGLRHMLEACGHQVVGAAEDGLEALVKARALQPDLILMDVNMPGGGGLEATRRIKSELPDVKIVMLSAAADDDDLFEALRSGAAGYLVKSVDEKTFRDLLSRMEQGEPPLAPGLAARILAEFANPRPRALRDTVPVERMEEELSDRQKEILTMVAQGFTYKEIGSALYLSLSTIKYHMAEILDRLQLGHRSEAIAYAQRTGLVSFERSNVRLRAAS